MSDAAAALPHDSPDAIPTIFRIGGEDVPVPSLTLYELEKGKDLLIGLTPGRNWIEYAADVIRVLEIRLEHLQPRERWTAEAMKRRSSVPEMRRFSGSMNDLLTASGFASPGEENAAAETPSPGTGTSTDSSPISPSAASAEAISEGSSAP